MITLNVHDFMFIFCNFLFLAIRILSFVAIAPLLGDKSIPKKIQLFITFILSWFFMLIIPKVKIDLFSSDGLLILFEQILIGMSLGFAMQLIFSAIKVAGEIISFQMGLSFSSLLDWNTHSNISVLSRFLYIFLLLLFLEFNGHILMISVLFDTFRAFPITPIKLDSEKYLRIVIFTKFVFIDGFMLMLPVIIIQLILNFSMGILNRIASQISIFSIGFTVTLLIGVYTVYLFIPTIPYVYNNIFNRLMWICSILSKG
ncbi:MAG: flagellar biosynthetic protein FliR [Buchnera aphidicola (Melaphis rhois)]